MSFVYSLFLKRAGEELSQFDNRISNMLPVAAGLVFFDMRNYRNDNGEFNVYIEWNEELNSVLIDRLPSGGYFIKATGKQARQLEENTGGIPVYMKLIAHEGRLYPYRTYVMWNGRPFSVEFNGNILIPVDYKKKAETVKIQGSQNGSKGNRMDVSGSQMSSSQRSLFGTSQSGLLIGSNREFWMSSNRPWTYEWEYENGSQRSLFSTSQRGNFFGSQSRLFGTSQQSFLFGSQRGFLAGSNRSVLTGSNRNYLAGSRYTPTFYQATDGGADDYDIPHWYYMPPEWQLINRSKRPCSRKGGNSTLGNGLDLI